jgi:archaellum component FlaG (FlaF/FlaG flagellin family)
MSPAPNTTPPGSTTPPSSYPNGPSVNPNRSPSRTISVDAQRNLGGFSFEVSPSTAQVFVDGKYMGTAGEFTPQSQPLGVQPGNRRVELRADGYRTVQFEAQVVAGQVLPYQGALQR